jgi:hypothetical protein
MASTATDQLSLGENISHFGAVRFRLVGNGRLQLRFVSLDEVNTQILMPLPIHPVTNREQTRLANFIDQRAMLEGKTTEFRERFRINRIIIFSKPIWTEYPGIE